MAVTNDQYLDAILSQGGDAVEAIIPSPILNGVSDTLSAFYTDPLRTMPSQGAWDTFSDLFGRWATRIAIHSYQWNSPFEEFVEPLTNGRGQEIVALETPEVKTFDAFKSDLLVRDYGNPHTVFIPMNFEPRKTISINETTIRTAILEPGQLSEYTNAQVDTLVNADKIATYAFMKKTLGNAILNKGFKNWQITFADPAKPTPEELKSFSKAIRIFSSLFTVAPSALYNSKGITTITPSVNDLVVFTTPQMVANLDVDVLADAFNVSKADISQRVIILDSLPYRNLWAVLADRRMLREFRQTRTIAGMPFDPSTQSFNLSLVHRSAIGFDPFVNAIGFSSEPTTVDEVIKITRPTGITARVVSDAGTELAQYNPRSALSARVVVTPEGEAYDPESLKDSARVKVGYTTEITAENADGEDVKLNSRTYVDEFGIIHVQKSLPVEGVTLHIRVLSLTNENPSGTVLEAANTKPLETVVDLTIGTDNKAK